MMPPPGLHMYQPRVTLFFDLMTSKVDRFMPVLCGPLASKSVHMFPKYYVHKFCIRQTNKQTDKWTGRKQNASVCHSGPPDALTT